MIDINKYKYKVSFFNVIENRQKDKYFDNYKDFSRLYYSLLGATFIKDLKAYKWCCSYKNFKEVVNV